MSAGDVARGLTTVNAGLTLYQANVFNNQCLTDMFVRGPLDGADPIDKFYVADVRRTYSGFLSDRTWVNAVKAQGAYEALARVGIAQPNLATVKNRNASAVSVANVGSNGNYQGSTYGQLGLHMAVPLAGIGQNASNFNTVETGGSLAATFSNGTALISTGGPQSVATVAFAGKSTGKALAELAAASENTTGQYAGGDDSFAQELNASGDTIQGVQLFSVPRFAGDTANLGPSGANFIGALQSGNITRAITSAGADRYTNALYPGLVGQPDLSTPAARQAAYSQFATVGGPSNTIQAGAASGLPAFVGGSPSSATSMPASCTTCNKWN